MKFQYVADYAVKHFSPLISSIVSASLLISHGLRFDVNLILLFDDEVYIRFEPKRLKYIRPDEQSTCGVVRKAVRGALNFSSFSSKEFSPGVFGGRARFSSLLKRRRQIYYAYRRGVKLDSMRVDENPTLVICYPYYGEDDLSLLLSLKAKPVRISLTYNCPSSLIVLFQNHCDRLFHRSGVH